jgi:hypothetical protein
MANWLLELPGAGARLLLLLGSSVFRKRLWLAQRGQGRGLRKDATQKPPDTATAEPSPGRPRPSRTVPPRPPPRLLPAQTPSCREAGKPRKPRPPPCPQPAPPGLLRTPRVLLGSACRGPAVQVSSWGGGQTWLLLPRGRRLGWGPIPRAPVATDLVCSSGCVRSSRQWHPCPLLVSGDRLWGCKQGGGSWRALEGGGSLEGWQAMAVGVMLMAWEVRWGLP